MIFCLSINFQSDSGTPAWKYDMGQAVLVGIMVEVELGGSICSVEVTHGDDPSGYGAATQVKPYIDFIKNVTNLK